MVVGVFEEEEAATFLGVEVALLVGVFLGTTFLTVFLVVVVVVGSSKISSGRALVGLLLLLGVDEVALVLFVGVALPLLEVLVVPLVVLVLVDEADAFLAGEEDDEVGASSKRSSKLKLLAVTDERLGVLLWAEEEGTGAVSRKSNESMRLLLSSERFFSRASESFA